MPHLVAVTSPHEMPVVNVCRRELVITPGAQPHAAEQFSAADAAPSAGVTSNVYIHTFGLHIIPLFLLMSFLSSRSHYSLITFPVPDDKIL
jgi:hypothetical protein